MRHLIKTCIYSIIISFSLLNMPLWAEPNFDVNTPAVAAVKTSMQQRHQELMPHYASGAIGFTQDGMIAVRDASLVKLSQRGALANLVKDENADRIKLYQGIADANGHPEWASVIQKTFASRWIDKARTGWFVQKNGQWAVQK